MSAAGTLSASTSLRDRGLTIWAAFGAVLPCVLPNLGPLVLALSVLMPVLLADRQAIKKSVFQIGPLAALLAVIVAYLTVNALFATVTDNALGAMATIAIAGLACHIGAAAFPAVPERDLKLMVRGLLIGFMVVAALLFVEYVSRMSLQRALQHATEGAQLKILRLDVGSWNAPASTHLSRNLVVLIMLLWGVLAFLRVIAREKSGQMLAPLLLIIVLIAALLSPSATAKVGLIAGAAAWIAAVYAPRLIAMALPATWALVSLLCIPIAHVIHAVRLYDAPWIGNSMSHRMLIWSASAEKFWQHPILGLGIGGARKVNLNEGLGLSTHGVEGEPLNWHAHNIFVQTWFETGLIGGLLLCLFGLLVLRAIFRLPDNVRPYAVAAFVSIFVIGLTGFSLWAAWYLAGYGLAALYIILSTFIIRDAPPLRQTTGG